MLEMLRQRRSPAQIGRDQARKDVSLRDLSVPPPSYRPQSDGGKWPIRRVRVPYVDASCRPVPAFPAADAQWGITTDDRGCESTHLPSASYVRNFEGNCQRGSVRRRAGRSIRPSPCRFRVGCSSPPRRTWVTTPRRSTRSSVFPSRPTRESRDAFISRTRMLLACHSTPFRTQISSITWRVHG